MNSDILRETERAASAIGRLDQAVAASPLRQAWIRRARLEAACRCAEVDGRRISPFRLAAMVEGLRTPTPHAGSLYERGLAHRAGAHALDLLDWMARAADAAPGGGTGGGTESDDDARRDLELAAALETLRQAAPDAATLTGAAAGVREGLRRGQGRGPLRAALARRFADAGLTRSPLPALTGARALRPDDGSDDPAAFDRAFLAAIRGEAEDGLRLIEGMTRAWRAAHAALERRERAAGGRKLRADSALPRAVDALSAASFLSPARLAAALGLSLRGAGGILARLEELGIAAEVSGRGSRRLYGVAALAPVRDDVAPRTRPVPGRKPGRPRGGDRSSRPTDEEFVVKTASGGKPAPPPADAPLRPDLAFDADMTALLADLLADIDRAERKARLALERLASERGAGGRAAS